MTRGKDSCYHCGHAVADDLYPESVCTGSDRFGNSSYERVLTCANRRDCDQRKKVTELPERINWLIQRRAMKEQRVAQAQRELEQVERDLAIARHDLRQLLPDGDDNLYGYGRHGGEVKAGG